MVAKADIQTLADDFGTDRFSFTAANRQFAGKLMVSGTCADHLYALRHFLLRTRVFLISPQHH